MESNKSPFMVFHKWLLYGTQSPSIEETFRPVGSHVVTLTPIPGLLENPVDLSEFISTEYHLTAEISNRQLGVRELSLILDVLNYQIMTWGANFSMILALTELLLRVSGGRRETDINDGNIRRTVLVSQIILKELGSSQFSLHSKERVLLRSEVIDILEPYLMNIRTYGSRLKTWRPEKFIKVKAVPVSILIERTPHRSERYSGYTKGYGESHGNAHKFKTKNSVELDGEDVPDRAERNLILRMTDPIHQQSNCIRIKYESLLQRD